MNKITTEIFTELLKSTEFWDKKEGKPLRNKLIDRYTIIREGLWFDRMYFPIACKMALLYKNHNIPARFHSWAGDEVTVVPIEEWYEEKVYFNQQDVSMWRPVDYMLMDWFDDRINELMECIWNNHPDWMYEEPTMEEILALGINPGNIAAQQVLMTGTELPTRDYKPKMPKPLKHKKPEDGPKQESLF